jgi:SAM-dependent methyltransferase
MVSDDTRFISVDPDMEEKRNKGIYDNQITREDRYTNPESDDYIIYHELSDLDWENRTYRILDVGSSTGEALETLVERLEDETSANFQAYALDIDRKVLEAAHEDMEAVRAAAQNLPFEDDSVDIVISANLYLRPEDIESTVHEIDRVMGSSDGKVVLSQGYRDQGYEGLHFGEVY